MCVCVCVCVCVWSHTGSAFGAWEYLKECLLLIGSCPRLNLQYIEAPALCAADSQRHMYTHMSSLQIISLSFGYLHFEPVDIVRIAGMGAKSIMGY